MKATVSKSLKSQFFYLGLYQIIGGGIGILILVWTSLFNVVEWNSITIILLGLFLVFFVYSVFCGLICLEVKRSALRQTMINQFLQVLSFSFMGFAFSYVAGIYLTLGIDLNDSPELKLNMGLSMIDLRINTDSQAADFHINLVALGIIYWVFQIIQKLKREEELNLI